MECSTLLAKIEGSVCGLITPVNVETRTFTVRNEGIKAKETYSKMKGAMSGLHTCVLLEEEDGKPESKKQAFEKTTEEVVLALSGTLKA